MNHTVGFAIARVMNAMYKSKVQSENRKEFPKKVKSE